MNTKYATTARAYYTAMSLKDTATMAELLDDSVELISPFDTTVGKGAVVESIKSFSKLFESLTIRTICENERHAVVIWDVFIPLPIGHLRAATLFSFTEEKISQIELFYDSHQLR